MTWLEGTQIAANVATAVGLFAVVIQLRELTAQNRMLVKQGANESHARVVEWDRSLWQIALENPQWSGDLVKQIWGKRFTGQDTSVHLFAVMLIDEFEHAYLRYKSGTFPGDDDWQSMRRYVIMCLRAPAVKAAWDANRYVWDQAFWSDFDAALKAPDSEQ